MHQPTAASRGAVVNRLLNRFSVFSTHVACPGHWVRNQQQLIISSGVHRFAVCIIMGGSGACAPASLLGNPGTCTVLTTELTLLGLTNI